MYRFKIVDYSFISLQNAGIYYLYKVVFSLYKINKSIWRSIYDRRGRGGLNSLTFVEGGGEYMEGGYATSQHLQYKNYDISLLILIVTG